jgi:hypothetical protein
MTGIIGFCVAEQTVSAMETIENAQYTEAIVEFQVMKIMVFGTGEEW